MNFSKKHLIIIGIIAFFLGATFVSVFPDPWHEKASVTLFEWVYREVWELIYGEKEGGE